MDVFFLTLKQMIMMFILILVGYFLRRKRILSDVSYVTMAKMETWVFVPALSLYTQITQCTIQTFKENASLILYGFVIVLCAILAAYPLSKMFVKNHKESPERTYERNVYKYAMTFGNFSFMGNFIVLGIWGNNVFFQYSMFTFLVSILCTTWGLYILIPKESSENLIKNLKKGLLTPPTIALVVGMLIGLLGLGSYVPDFLLSAFDSASKCQGPVAMLLAGFVVGGYNLKELIRNKKVYFATFLRLIVLPAIIVLVLKAIGTPKEVMTFALITFATPLGLNTIVYPAAYGGDTKTGASMAMISNVFAVITIPLMYLLLIG